MNDLTCEHKGCDRDGWVVLHFGPRLTPPLRVACREHSTHGELDDFEDRAES